MAVLLKIFQVDPSYFASSNPVVRHKTVEESPRTPITASPRKVAADAQPSKGPSKGMKLLTPKEWKALNDKKRANTLDQQTTDYDERDNFKFETKNTKATHLASSSRGEPQISIHESNGFHSNSRKRELSDTEQPAQLPPSLRHTATTSVESTSNQRTMAGSSNAVAGQQNSLQRPAPKPKTTSLFIPKKPPVRRRSLLLRYLTFL